MFLSERQAQAILDMRLGRLTGLEREKLEAEYKELWELTDYLEGLLSDDGKLMAAIIDELKAIREQFADPRRTQIVDAEGEILTEELIDEEDIVVTRSHLGYIKRTRAREYQAQGRGGRGITGATSTEGDFVADMFAASTHDHLLLFTDKGRVYHKKVFELPEGARTAKGRPIVNVLDLQDGEQVVAMLPFAEFSDDDERVLRDPGRHRQEDRAVGVRERPPERHQGDHDRRRRPPGRRVADHQGRRRAADLREGVRGPLHRGARTCHGPHRRRRPRHHPARG